MSFDKELIITEGCSALPFVHAPSRYKGKWYTRFLRRLKRLWRKATKFF